MFLSITPNRPKENSRHFDQNPPHKSEIRAPSKLWDSVSLVKITSQPVEFQLNACRAHTGSKAQGAWCASWVVPSRDSRARTRSPSPRAWRPDFPGAAREAP